MRNEFLMSLSLNPYPHSIQALGECGYTHYFGLVMI